MLGHVRVSPGIRDTFMIAAPASRLPIAGVVNGVSKVLAAPGVVSVGNKFVAPNAFITFALLARVHGVTANLMRICVRASPWPWATTLASIEPPQQPRKPVLGLVVPDRQPYRRGRDACHHCPLGDSWA